jgi:hypothetical protein
MRRFFCSERAVSLDHFALESYVMGEGASQRGLPGSSSARDARGAPL